ncbi:heparanase-like isoform X2 [Haliotis rufescens]|uniref:heparanase-like isoform X2 n=1 Tax=Haliotis rufescens TaxID=6454 RepID=UPI00201F64FA|nr:heparanase-like isoform X2 [Haliotis rufescens]
MRRPMQQLTLIYSLVRHISHFNFILPSSRKERSCFWHSWLIRVSAPDQRSYFYISIYFTADTMTVTRVLVILCSLHVQCTVGQSVSVTVATDKEIATIDDHFVGVTFDSQMLPISINWMGLDFGSPKVQTLAKALSPCYLRIGGTPGDFMTFDPTGHGGTSPDSTYTGAEWDKLNNFLETVGWDLVFGLNVLKRKDGQWDPDNAKELMTYSNARNYKIPAFELGNEPEYFPEPFTNTISGAQLGRDFVHLREIIKSTPGFESTLVIGPDVTGISGRKSILFQNFFEGEGSKAVDRITFHQYYAFEGDATVNTCLDPKVMDSLISDIHRVRNVTTPSNPDTPLWLWETSSFYGGGTPALSDRYVAGFLWLDKLGVASRMGLKGVLRQSYYGHNYSLIEMNTFEPYSDYWLTLLYKRLVGNKVLSVQTNSTNSFRVYAHCAKQNSVYNYKPGSVVIYIVNVNIYTTVVTFPQFQKNMDLFWLRPEFIELTSRNVTLNGKRLDYVNNTIPDMPPQKAYGGLLMLPARTFGFAVFPDADVDICK